MKLLSVAEVAQLCGVARATVNYWRLTGKINSSRVGFQWVTTEAEAQRVKKEREEGK